MADTNEQELELPKAVVRRIMKSKLQELTGDDEKKEFQINKDALLAFSESAKVFINMLSSTANEFCKESKRQTISADDVFKALEDLEFEEFVKPLKDHLDGETATHSGSKQTPHNHA